MIRGLSPLTVMTEQEKKKKYSLFNYTNLTNVMLQIDNWTKHFQQKIENYCLEEEGRINFSIMTNIPHENNCVRFITLLRNVHLLILNFKKRCSLVAVRVVELFISLILTCELT